MIRCCIACRQLRNGSIFEFIRFLRHNCLISSAPKVIPHYTIEDYQHREGGWELNDGIATAMTPSPYGHHERIISRLSFEVRRRLIENNCQCEIYTNLDWIVNDSTVIRPDLMVVCGIQPEKHLGSPPDLMVEVLSPSTRDNELIAKLQIALSNNVTNYLVIDPEERVLHRIADGDLKAIHSSEFSIELNEGCTISIGPAELFDK